MDRALIFLGAGPVLIRNGEAPKFFAHAAQSSAHHAWRTPPELLKLLYEVFGSFDLDPCSPTRSPRRAPVRARVHFTEEDNGLNLSWHGTVFLNPPYGRTIGLWTAKAKREVAAENARAVLALLPARTDTAWWHNDIAGSASVLFLQGRLSFSQSGQSAPFPSALVLWGDAREEFAALQAAIPEAWAISHTSSP